MALRLGDIAPDFDADSSSGPIHFHEWLGDSWCVLFSHPKDFTPVCTTELGAAARLHPEFKKRGCKLLGLSVDSAEEHLRWFDDIETTQECTVKYPVIADTDLSVAKSFGMIHPNVNGTAKGRTAVDNQTVRSVFIIAPDKSIKLILTYPMSTGRNFQEILRCLDSLQLTAKHQVATPADWTPGDDVIIVPAVSDEQAKEKWPDGWTAPKPYLRFVAQPQV